MLKEKDLAPSFSAPDQTNINRKLSDYKGRWVLLYFYPKDNTPGCTKEACNFRDSYHQLQKLGLEIIGVSKDSVQSHQKFAVKYELNFPLLSDPDKIIINQYHAWGVKKFLGKEFSGTLRVSYLIDPQGKIAKVYKTVNPLTHAQVIIKDYQDLINK